MVVVGLESDPVKAVVDEILSAGGEKVGLRHAFSFAVISLRGVRGS